MSSQTERHSILAPLGIELRTKLALAAIEFFNPRSYTQNCAISGRTPDLNTLRPLAAFDFLAYLENKNILQEPHKYSQRIRHLLEQMASNDILIDMGHGRSGNVLIPKHYYFLKELTKLQRSGIFWLAPVLGADFIFHYAAPGIVQISGTKENGDKHAGTGIVFHPHHILTCRHVVCDMKVDSQQTFQGVECTIEDSSIHTHPKLDVAVIHVPQCLQPVAGLAFLSPIIAQSVFTIGYPRIPFTREPVLTMQPGAVTSESVTALSGEDLFLYSAIARPGNSGGPVISNEGYIVGIALQDLMCTDDAFSPHYAGIPSHELAKAVDELGIGVQIPFERFK
ncbi:MAG: serine protease [Gemmatimonadota bacterium]|nr:serine protease [Gemmatimonadota bacterium]